MPSSEAGSSDYHRTAVSGDPLSKRYGHVAAVDDLSFAPCVAVGAILEAWRVRPRVYRGATLRPGVAVGSERRSTPIRDEYRACLLAIATMVERGPIRSGHIVGLMSTRDRASTG